MIGRPLLFASVDADVARAAGVPTGALGARLPAAARPRGRGHREITGALLVFALLVTPAATAQQITARPGPGLASRSALALAVTWLGLGIAYFSPYPVGFWVTSLSFGLYVAVRLLLGGASPAAGARAARSARLMFAHEFMRNAYLAGTFVALACGLVGYFVVLRSQVFAGDALSHVAFTGALAAAAAGIDVRLGLFVATIAVALGMGLLGERARPDDVVIGSVFAWVLGLGALFLSIFTSGSSGENGTAAVRVLFGSILGLSAADARLAAVIAVLAALALLAITRPLLFGSLDPDVARGLGVPVRALGIGFFVLLAVVAAEATQAVGALLLLGLLAAPGGAARLLTDDPGAVWRCRPRSPSPRCGSGSRSATGSLRCRRVRGDRDRDRAFSRRSLRCRPRSPAPTRGSTRYGRAISRMESMSTATETSWADHALAALRAAGYRRGGARSAVIEALAATTAPSPRSTWTTSCAAARPQWGGQHLPRPRAARAARPRSGDRGRARNRRL